MLLTQQTRSTRQMSFFSKFKELTPNIKFDCVVNGMKLTASFTSIEDTGTEKYYHISFSDGFQDAYQVHDTVAQNGFRSVRMTDAYGKAILDDLCMLQTFIEKEETGLMNFRVQELGRGSFNIWLYEQRGTYNVHYKGDYHFTLRKRDRWEVRTKREKSYRIDRQLAKVVCDHLDLHLP